MFVGIFSKPRYGFQFDNNRLGENEKSTYVSVCFEIRPNLISKGYEYHLVCNKDESLSKMYFVFDLDDLSRYLILVASHHREISFEIYSTGEKNPASYSETFLMNK